MIQRYKIVVRITPTLNSDYDVVPIAVPDDQGDYARYDAVSHLIEEKTIEQHRDEFQEWLLLDQTFFDPDSTAKILQEVAYKAWLAARGVKE